MLREEQHAQAWQDRMDVLKGRTIPPRVGAMGLEVSSSQSITSLAAGAARCGTMGHSGTGSRRVKQLGESQEQRVLRASWRSKSCSEEDGSSKDGYGELSLSVQASVLQLPRVAVLHQGPSSSGVRPAHAQLHRGPMGPALCAVASPRGSHRIQAITLLWVERSQPGRAETTAGFAEPRLVPHYCHKDLDAVRVSLCPDRRREKGEDTQHGSVGRAQCLLQQQSLCPAPARAPTTLTLPQNSHLGTERSPTLPKILPGGKGVFPENHCCGKPLDSWEL